MYPTATYWPQCQPDDEIIFSPVRIINENTTLVELIKPLSTREYRLTTKKPYYLLENFLIPSSLYDQKIYLVGKIKHSSTRLKAGTVMIHQAGGLQLVSCEGCDSNYIFKKPYLVCEKCNKVISHVKISKTYGQIQQIQQNKYE